MREVQQKIPSRYNEAIFEFVKYQRQFKFLQTRFEETKKEFYELMNKCFDEKHFNGSAITDCSDVAGNAVIVTKVQKSKVIFDVARLKKALGKKLSKDVVTKRYEVADMPGLIEYLKGCNVDPKVFSSFLVVTEEVDTKALEKLEELGRVNLADIKGCYKVETKGVYFTVKAGSGDGDRK